MNKLVVYYSTTFYKTASEKYYCNGGFGRYLELLAKKYEKIYVCVPIKEIKEGKDYKLNTTNIEIQEIPYYGGVTGGILKESNSMRYIEKYAEAWEGKVYIRWPSPYSHKVYKLAKKKGLDVVVHIVGNQKKVIEEGNKYTGFIKKLAVMYANLEEKRLVNFIKNEKVLANGQDQRDLYYNNCVKYREIRTSTILDSEIEKKNFGKNLDIINILYVGYLRHEKGLEFLLRAFKDLKDALPNKKIKLTIVGEGDERGNLEELTNQLGIEKDTEFKGFIPMGDSLLEIYSDNNIFILPSLSEGTPRVLIEAMSKGLYVLASNVGGIPYTITNEKNGILFNPKDKKSIVSNINKLLNNKDLQKTLSEEMYKFSKENTLEMHVEEVYSFMEEENYEKV